MGFLSKKSILITGISSKKSIAYGIAKVLKTHGANLALSFQNERLREKVQKIAEEIDCSIVIPCDVSRTKEIENLFKILKKSWNTFDGIVHSIAFAPKNQLQGTYLDSITKDAFLKTHEISAYSLSEMIKSSIHMFNKNFSAVTITYLGSEKVVQNYNVMGIAKASLEASVKYLSYSLGKLGFRINAISSGPIKTIAALGIKNFKKMLSSFKKICPLNRLVTIEEIGNTCLFLLSNLSSGINGEIIHVDGGFNKLSPSLIIEE
ncbi:enoyl-ACP reductase FabI [bacterium endosymbiont of Pedicinus badii]|uniref:enoyl-ACP reductase FabI n=1 Tax=bacterium endosymbiont of Pedicinus badii TaxID=1719126 RepID=UPI0009BA5417|nr:enoyl-ACP reductase [bacterium endosymbiont of Pedicinus badii]OQM34404.1 enoyl-ACP reductase [bacterium endosymbiont of Pedicinus badii]